MVISKNGGFMRLPKKSSSFSTLMGIALFTGTPTHTGWTDYLINKKASTLAAVAVAGAGALLYDYQRSSLSLKGYLQQLKDRVTKSTKALFPGLVAFGATAIGSVATGRLSGTVANHAAGIATLIDVPPLTVENLEKIWPSSGI
jgi:hypothetical protein